MSQRRGRNHQAKESRRAGLHHDQRGAVLAEFVVVLVPLLTIFFVFVQLSAIAAASLVVKHSAVIGARAAAVLSNKNNNVPEREGKGDGEGDIRAGVEAALGPWKDRMGVAVTVTDRSTRDKPDGPYELVTVTVTATYRCEVPLGKAICPGGVKIIRDTKSMPHQGARYKK